VLTVAAPSPGTEAERAAHRLFTLWDSGVRVLGGVAAFRPYDDPKTKRRQSDVVLLVPDGVIVVRVVGSQRQNGPIVTHPTGAWSIGGEVLRIAGGGSNPLPALRDAQAALSSTLRASGLEPGRVAMLVAVGSGEPVQPNHGRIDDGIIVCPLSEEGLAIGVRRAAALTAAADVRQWTTADVKAALSSIEASGRVPAVEELNSEGFMYSPYILRRPDLVAAASAVAASTATDSAAASRSQVEDPASLARRPDDGGPPTQVRQAHANDDVADNGWPEIFGSDANDDRSPRSEMPPASLDQHRGGFSAAEDHYEDRDPGPSYAQEPYAGRSHLGDGRADNPGRGKGLRRVLAVLVALLLVGAASYVGFSLLRANDAGDVGDGGDAQATGETTQQTAEPIQQVGDHMYLRVLSRDGETCAGNADGEVAAYFDATNCASLIRELYTTEIDGVGVLVSVSRVTMPAEAAAEEFKVIVDSDGTGNVDDLLEAGERIDNGPTELIPEAYHSGLDGAVVTIIVAGWLDPAVTGDEAALDQLATEALGLDPPA